MRFKRRLLRKGDKLSTASMEPILSHWLERALADEQGRAFLRAALRQHELPVIDLESPGRSSSPRALQA